MGRVVLIDNVVPVLWIAGHDLAHETGPGLTAANIRIYIRLISIMHLDFLE